MSQDARIHAQAEVTVNSHEAMPYDDGSEPALIEIRIEDFRWRPRWHVDRTSVTGCLQSRARITVNASALQGAVEGKDRHLCSGGTRPG